MQVLLCQCSLPAADNHVCIFSLQHVLPSPDAGQRQLRERLSEQLPARRKQERGGGRPGARQPAGNPHSLHPRATRPLPAADARDVMDGLHPLPIQEEVMCSGAASLQHAGDKSPEQLKIRLGGKSGWFAPNLLSRSLGATERGERKSSFFLSKLLF